jgi:hypothetical protein
MVRTASKISEARTKMPKRKRIAWSFMEATSNADLRLQIVARG